MIYFLLLLLTIIFIYEIINYNRVNEPVVDPLVYLTEGEITHKIRLIHEYYVEQYIGEERMKDTEWMTKNSRSDYGVPTWRLHMILNNPPTSEGLDFNTRSRNYSNRFDDLKKRFRINDGVYNMTNPNYLIELQKLNEEADKLFPKVFISIKRDEKLNKLI